MIILWFILSKEEADAPDSFVLVPMSSDKIQREEKLEHDELPSYDSLYQQEAIKNKEETDLLMKQLQQDSDNLRYQLSAEMESNKNKQ